MRIDAEAVRRLARLARIPVDEAELPALTRQLSEVLHHLDAISRTGAGATEPELAEPAAPTRDDEPAEGLAADVLAGLVPHWNPPYVVAPPNPALHPRPAG